MLSYGRPILAAKGWAGSSCSASRAVATASAFLPSALKAIACCAIRFARAREFGQRLLASTAVPYTESAWPNTC